jgi:hypothetical protein
MMLTTGRVAVLPAVSHPMRVTDGVATSTDHNNNVTRSRVENTGSSLRRRHARFEPSWIHPVKRRAQHEAGMNIAGEKEVPLLLPSNQTFLTEVVSWTEKSISGW